MSFFHVYFGLLTGVVVCLQVGLKGTISATTVPSSSRTDVQSTVSNGSSSSTKPASTASSSDLPQSSSFKTSQEVLSTKTTNSSNSSDVSSTQNPSVPTAMTSKSENGTGSNTIGNETNESTTSVVPKQTPTKATDKTKAPGLQIVTSPKTLAYEGIQAVAGVCIVIASVLIIACVAFLAKFERHHEKLKKEDCFTGDGKQSNLTFTQSVGPVTVKTVKM